MSIFSWKDAFYPKNTCFIEYQQKKLNNSDKNATYIKKSNNIWVSNIFEVLQWYFPPIHMNNNNKGDLWII